MGVNYIIYILNIIYIIIYIILRAKFAGGKEMKKAFVKVLKCYSVKEALLEARNYGFGSRKLRFFGQEVVLQFS